jgi:GT2 family glycosyltransferase
MRFFVVMPVHNRVNLTVQALECLRLQTWRNYEVVLIDDGSTDGTAETVRARFPSDPSIEILTGDGNLWWGGAVRLGVERVLSRQDLRSDDMIVLMNDDTSFEPDLFARASELIVRNPGVILASIVLDEDSSTVLYAGAAMKCWPLGLTYRPFFNLRIAEISNPRALVDVDFIGAESTFVPVEVFRRAGNINSHILPHYHSDGEFFYRAKRTGYRVAVAPELIVRKSAHTTAKFNDFSKHEKISDVIPSLFMRRSPHNLKDRLRFAWLACPRVWLPMFVVADTVKLFCRILTVLLLGPKATALRQNLNYLLTTGGTNNRRP